MDDENNRSFVRSREIPEWMASGLGKIAPVAIVSTLGAGLLLWTNFAVLDTRVQRLESFAGAGERFSASEGGEHLERIKELERWQRSHDAYRYETTGKINEQFRNLDRRLQEIERRHDNGHGAGK